jgi:hypothetical protein
LIESLPGGVHFDEAFIARLLHPPGDLVDHPIPALLLPAIGARGAVKRASQATFAEDVVFERDAFGAERAAIDRMVGVALDVDDGGARDVFGPVPERVDDHAATDRAVGAGRSRLGRARNLQLADGRVSRGEIEAEGDDSTGAGDGYLDKVSPRNSHELVPPERITT